MPESFKTKSVLCLDNGGCVSLAEKLGESFGRVNYWSSWKSAFPSSNAVLIGTGVPGVTRVNDFWDVLPETDIVVIGDLYYPGLAIHLRDEMGFPVWAGAGAEELETDRVGAKEQMKRLGIPIGKYRVIKGIDKLRNFLESHEDVYVKTNWRGDFESFHSKNWDLIKPRIAEIGNHLGAGAEVAEFIVEDSIPDATEIALDAYCVDGQFPNLALLGAENKDSSYAGIMLDADDWPKQVTDANEKLAPMFKEAGCRQFVALETRVTKDGTGYVNDPCIRMSSPPGGALLEHYKNIAEIIWHGAHGRCVDPEPAGKFCVSLVIYSEWAEQQWQAVHYPKKIAANVKLKNYADIGGTRFVIPQQVGLCEIGEICASGDTLEEARERVKGFEDKVQGFKVKTYSSSLDEAEESLDKLKALGVKI